jgi:hypothetical protein
MKISTCAKELYLTLDYFFDLLVTLPFLIKKYPAKATGITMYPFVNAK